MSQEKIFVENRSQAVVIIKNIFCSRLDNRFGLHASDPLDYHCKQHSQRVALWTRKGLETIRSVAPDLVSLEDFDLGEIEGLGHDLVQKSFKDPAKWRNSWRGYKDQDISPLHRARGVTVGNERASADEILEELSRFVYQDKSFVFPVDEDEWRASIMADIGATYPVFERLSDGASKVFQPYLVPKISLCGLCLANADLRSDLANCDTRAFHESGDALLRELWFELTERMRHNGVEGISHAERCLIVEQILDWMRSQAGFAREQEGLFLDSLDQNIILNAHPKAWHIKQALCRLYGLPLTVGELMGNFHNNIAAARMRYVEEDHYGSLADTDRRRHNLMNINDHAFRRLLHQVGYKVPA